MVNSSNKNLALFLFNLLFIFNSLNSFAQIANLCGNGVIDAGEACDLGSTRNNGSHGCESNCTVSKATNGLNWICTRSPETFRYHVTSRDPMSLRSLFFTIRARNFDTTSAEYILNKKCGIANVTLTPEEKLRCDQFIREFIRFKDLNYNIAIKIADPSVSDDLCPTGGLIIKQYDPVTLMADGTYTILCNQPTS